jgi:chorismate mutase
VLIHVNTERSQRDMVHVYLREAVSLRPDLVSRSTTPQ